MKNFRKRVGDFRETVEYAAIRIGAMFALLWPVWRIVRGH
jgi:hypothetical protein